MFEGGIESEEAVANWAKLDFPSTTFDSKW